MKLLIAGDYTQHWRAPAWVRGLQELGVNIVEYDWRKDYTRHPFLAHTERRYLIGPAIVRINRRLIKVAEQTNPDLILIFAGQPIYPQTIRTLTSKYPVAGYHNDDPFGIWGRRRYWRYYVQSLPEYTCHHVFRELNISEYQQHGCSRVKLLRYFYLPWMHFPINASELQPNGSRNDVVFIGQGQPGKRIDYITTLVEAGVKIGLYGDARTWKKYLPSHIYKKLSPILPSINRDYARTVALSKICLALLSEVHRDDYTVRSFEIPACRGFMLSERTDCMRSLFTEDVEAAYFSGVDELINKVQFYRNNDGDRLSIADKGYRRCIVDGYDVFNRMRQWISDLVDWNLLSNTSI